MRPTSFGFFFCRLGNGLKVIGLLAGLHCTTYCADFTGAAAIVVDVDGLVSVGDVLDVCRFESLSRISLFSLMSCLAASELFWRPCCSLDRLLDTVSSELQRNETLES